MDTLQTAAQFAQDMRSAHGATRLDIYIRPVEMGDAYELPRARGYAPESAYVTALMATPGPHYEASAYLEGTSTKAAIIWKDGTYTITPAQEEEEQEDCQYCGRSESGYGTDGKFCHRHADK